MHMRMPLRRMVAPTCSEWTPASKLMQCCCCAVRKTTAAAQQHRRAHPQCARPDGRARSKHTRHMRQPQHTRQPHLLDECSQVAVGARDVHRQPRRLQPAPALLDAAVRLRLAGDRDERAVRGHGWLDAALLRVVVQLQQRSGAASGARGQQQRLFARQRYEQCSQDRTGLQHLPCLHRPMRMQAQLRHAASCQKQQHRRTQAQLTHAASCRRQHTPCDRTPGTRCRSAARCRTPS